MSAHAPFEICKHCAGRVGMYEPARIQLTDGTTLTGSVLGVAQTRRGEVAGVWHSACVETETLSTDDAASETLSADACVETETLSTDDTASETLSTDAGVETETLSTDDTASETLSTDAGSETLDPAL